MTEQRHWAKATITFPDGHVLDYDKHRGYRTAQDALAEVAARRARHNPVIEGLTITWTDRTSQALYKIEYEDAA